MMQDKLVKDLPRKKRDTVIVLAEHISRPWWPYSAYGSLHQAVWIQVLKDLGSEEAFTEALCDWLGHGDHWYTRFTRAGIDQQFLWQKMIDWHFVTPEHAHFDIDHRTCRTCGEQKHRYDFVPSRYGGLSKSCNGCLTEKRHASPAKK